jgi:hypothetical protein
MDDDLDRPTADEPPAPPTGAHRRRLPAAALFNATALATTVVAVALDLKMPRAQGD